MNENEFKGEDLESNTDHSVKAWEKPVVMRLAVSQAEGANNYDDDMDFKGSS
jgi:hypothetical protein